MLATKRKPKVKPPLESVILKDCMAVYKRLGIPAWRRNVAAMVAEGQGKRRFIKAGEKGQADTWGILPGGRHLEFEAKRPGNKPTLDQALWLRSTNEAGGASFWADSPEVMERVLRCLVAGGSIHFLDTTWKYEGIEGPGADYNVDLDVE